jgi:hypothetical protein
MRLGSCGWPTGRVAVGSRHGCPWVGSTCTCAALRGHLHVLIWALSNGCRWDEHVCSAAVRGAHLAVLEWARANGCPWGSLNCARARALMEAEELDEDEEGVLRREGLMMPAVRDEASRRPRRRRRVATMEEVIEWLKANGCPEGDDAEAAEADGDDASSDGGSDTVY